MTRLRTVRFSTLIVGLMLTLPHDSFADDATKNVEAVRRDSANLKQLLVEVRRVLPAGWRAEITPDVPSDLVQPWAMNRASLAIWRKDKALGHRGYDNPPPIEPGQEEAQYEPVIVSFQWTVAEFLTPEEYEKAAADNERRQAQRLAFLVHAEAGHMGPLPIRPYEYRPKTDEAREEARQYSLLWQRTEPKKLPTHYYKTLAFEADFDDRLGLQDPKIQAERDKVREAVAKIITAYKTDGN